LLEYKILYSDYMRYPLYQQINLIIYANSYHMA